MLACQPSWSLTLAQSSPFTHLLPLLQPLLLLLQLLPLHRQLRRLLVQGAAACLSFLLAALQVPLALCGQDAQMQARSASSE
jgi:hypothetical protein